MARRISPSAQRRDPSSHAPRRAPQDDVRGDPCVPSGTHHRTHHPAGHRALLATFVALALLALAACSGGTQPTRRRLPDGWRLIQKQGYQALYAPSGRLARVLNDSDADGIAEAVVFYREDGRPGRSELDTDGDHVIDRWETLRRDGTVSLSAHSRRKTGTPDTWEYADAQGFVFQTEFDDDGDGEADRTEYAQRPQAPTDAGETP